MKTVNDGIAKGASPAKAIEGHIEKDTTLTITTSNITGIVDNDSDGNAVYSQEIRP